MYLHLGLPKSVVMRDGTAAWHFCPYMARIESCLQVVQGDQSGKEPPLATPAADVWALGVIAYEVLCGTSS